MYVHNAQFTEAEATLINKGKLLYEKGDNKYYLLSLRAFDDSIIATKKYLQHQYDKLIQHNGYASFNTIDNCIVKNFNNQKVPYPAFGGGALYKAKETAELYSNTLPNAYNNTTYEASMWLYSDIRTSSFPEVTLVQTGINGEEIEKKAINGNKSTTSIGNWVRVSIPFTLQNKNNKICISAYGEFATYDELVIRPTSTEVVIPSENGFMYNNYPIY